MQYAHVAAPPCVLTFGGQGPAATLDRQSQVVRHIYTATSQQPSLRSERIAHSAENVPVGSPVDGD